MSALLEQQRALRVQLLGPNAVEPPPRLQIYRNTCVATLTQALRLTYPVVRRLVGEEFFDVAARTFVAGTLPQQANLNAYGDGFDAFLADFEPAASLSYLPDVVRLEWAVNRALHARDRSGLALSALAQLPEARLPHVCLVPHPALSLLQLASPADQIWQAVLQQDDQALAAIDPDGGAVYLLIERDDDGIQVRRMQPHVWQWTAELAAGQPLRRCLEHADEHTHAVLADHLARGRFIDFRLDA